MAWADVEREHDAMRADRDALRDKNDALRARVAKARSLLLKMCETVDHMPDDVAEWLHDESN